MNQKDINEAHLMLVEHFLKKDFKPSQIMSFLTATFIGQMALNGYSDDFFDKTVERMKVKFINHPLRKNK